MMKKLQVLFLGLVLGGAVLSCSKEESNDGLEGKWTYDTFTYTDVNGTTEPTVAYDPACSDRKYFYFKSGGKMEFGIVNSSLSSTDPCKFYLYTDCSWKLENDSISTTVVGDTRKMKLVSVSGTNLVVKYGKENTYYTYTLKRS